LLLQVAVQVALEAEVHLVVLEDFGHLLRQLAVEALQSHNYLLLRILLSQ
jgi:hypothetical protein